MMKLVRNYGLDGLIYNIMSEYQSQHEVYKDSGLGKWFHNQSAGGEPGWDRYNTKGEKIGKCGDKSPGEGKPKCLSRQKAAKMSKKEIANAVKRKRRKDPDTDRPGTGNKPINVSNRIGENRMKSFKTFIAEKNVPTNPKLWAASIAAAKSKFDVYPSAYANAWASKHYKSKGGGWKKEAKESVEDCGCVNEKKSAAWQRKEGKSKDGGLNEKGRKSYERENPGSDLKAPSKKVGNPRRASFCARMKGMKAKLTSAKTANDPDSRINKALRAWNC